MNIDFKSDLKSKPVFKLVSLILGVIFLLFGVPYTLSKINVTPFQFDHNLQFGIAAIGWGLICVFIGLKGGKSSKDGR